MAELEESSRDLDVETTYLGTSSSRQGCQGIVITRGQQTPYEETHSQVFNNAAKITLNGSHQVVLAGKPTRAVFPTSPVQYAGFKAVDPVIPPSLIKAGVSFGFNSDQKGTLNLSNEMWS